MKLKLSQKEREFFKRNGARAGRIGAAKLTPQQRQEKARKAATMRWIDQAKNTALQHAAADAECGRKWECACAACRIVREQMGVAQ